MAYDIFDKFNSRVDGAELAKSVKEVEKNGGTSSYEKQPYGKYEVAIEKMEIVATKPNEEKGTKGGDPMISVWFKIVAGDRKGKMIFMNRTLMTDYTIHLTNEFLRSLITGIEKGAPAVEFDGNYRHYNNLILDIHEKINNNFEYLLDFSQNSKGFDTFTIEEVFILE